MGVAALVAALAVAVAASFTARGTAPVFFGSDLLVGNVTGPDKPLAWRDTKKINSGEIVRFKWTNSEANVTARWEVVKAGSVVPVASGPIASVPAPGKEALFSIDFRKFIPAQAPANGQNYDVVVKTYPKQAIARTANPPRIVVRPPGGGIRATTNRRATIIAPKSVSSKATVAYVRPGAPTRFDSDMGFSRRLIRIDLNTLHVGDEDDPSSNDEPYAVMVRFRFRTLFNSDGSVAVQPGTLEVAPVGASCQNNMGRSDDNWSDEDDDPYDVRSANLRVIETVPTGQVGWVVGAVVVMFEEDALAYERSQLMRDKIVEETRKAIESMNFSNVNPNAISDAVKHSIIAQIIGSFKPMFINFVDLIGGIIQAADPDDIAGFNAVIAFTAPGGSLAMTSGQPPANQADLIAQAVPVGGSRGFRLSYPAGDLSMAPGIARYEGQMSLDGVVSTRLLR